MVKTNPIFSSTEKVVILYHHQKRRSLMPKDCLKLKATS